MELASVIILVILAIIIFNSSFGLVGLLISLLAWAIAGHFAGKIVLKRSFGVLGNIAIGLLGGIIGNFLVRALNLGILGGVPLIGGILVGIFGAVVLLLVVKTVTGRR